MNFLHSCKQLWGVCEEFETKIRDGNFGQDDSKKIVDVLLRFDDLNNPTVSVFNLSLLNNNIVGFNKGSDIWVVSFKDNVFYLRLITVNSSRVIEQEATLFKVIIKLSTILVGESQFTENNTMGLSMAQSTPDKTVFASQWNKFREAKNK